MGFLSNLFGTGPQKTQMQTKLPEEIAPYVKDVLTDTQKLYQQRMGQGYDPYSGQAIADMTEDQLRAREGIRGLVGTQAPLLQEALGGMRGGTERLDYDKLGGLQGDYGRIGGLDYAGTPTGFTQTQFQEKPIEEYMSPYQRAVTDIEKREAQKAFEERVMPQFEKQAIAAGGMSGMGSRAGVQAGLLGQAQMQQLGDIEKHGLQESYADAQRRKAVDFQRFQDQRSFEERGRGMQERERAFQKGERAFGADLEKGERDFQKGERTFDAQQFAARKARERQSAGDIAQMAPQLYGAQARELGGLETVGAAGQALEQKGLDKAYADWLEEREFPEQQLARYMSSIYGNPLLRTPSTETTTPGKPLGQQLIGLAGSLAGGGFFNKQHGGYIGGLSDLPEAYRNNGGIVYRKYSGTTDSRFKQKDPGNVTKEETLDDFPGQQIGLEYTHRMPVEVDGRTIMVTGTSKEDLISKIQRLQGQSVKPQISSRTMTADPFGLPDKNKAVSEEKNQAIIPKDGLTANLRKQAEFLMKQGRGLQEQIPIETLEQRKATLKKQNKEIKEEKQANYNFKRDIIASIREPFETEMKELIKGTKLSKQRAWIIIGASIASHPDGILMGFIEGLNKVHAIEDVKEEKIAAMKMKLREIQYTSEIGDAETEYQFKMSLTKSKRELYEKFEALGLKQLQTAKTLMQMGVSTAQLAKVFHDMSKTSTPSLPHLPLSEIVNLIEVHGSNIISIDDLRRPTVKGHRAKLGAIIRFVNEKAEEEIKANPQYQDKKPTRGELSLVVAKWIRELNKNEKLRTQVFQSSGSDYTDIIDPTGKRGQISPQDQARMDVINKRNKQKRMTVQERLNLIGKEQSQ